MDAPLSPLPPDSAPRSLDGDVVGALVVVGLIALIFVSYLTVDWLKTRREARELSRKRERAREAWQRELGTLRQSKSTPSRHPEDRE